MSGRTITNLPQSKLFRIEIKVKMCDGYLHTLRIIQECQLIADSAIALPMKSAKVPGFPLFPSIQ